MERLSCPLSSPTLASDHPNAFKKDVVDRAKAYAAGLGGGVGAYTNSQGIPAVREVNIALYTRSHEYYLAWYDIRYDT